FFQLFEKYNGPKTGHLKLKHPGQLQEVLDITRILIKELNDNRTNRFPNSSETRVKLFQLKQVLELYGHFSGINRKIQLKYLSKGLPKKTSSDDEPNNVSPQPSLLLIVKWGGQLTQTGKNQAEVLGKAFRKMYPGGQSAGGDRPDVGLLRLHSTFRHDLKIYASDEGRVQMTAAAFAKGLLALDGELAPILVQMVKSANTNGLLDNDVDSTKEQQKVKRTLHDLLAKDRQFTAEDYDIIAPTRSRSLVSSMDFIKNPVTICRKIYDYILEMITLIQSRSLNDNSGTLFQSETWDLCLRRWLKLGKDFYDARKDKFNISKVPDIYDSIKYELLHNKDALQFPYAEDLYVCSKALADIVVPQEYGVTIEEKLSIARGIITPLLRKIRADLQCNLTGVITHDEHVNKLDPIYSSGIQTPGRHVRTRLYFTSESHVHSLLTVIRYGGLLDVSNDEQWKRSMEHLDTVSELNYLTQIVIMLYEDSSEEEDSERRFHVELHFSPGAYGCFDVLPEIDSVSPNINSIRTVLPKSNRQAAHSPPRHQIERLRSVSPPTTVQSSMSSSLTQHPLNTTTTSLAAADQLVPESPLIADDNTKQSIQSEKLRQKVVKQRSFSSKTIYRSNSAMIPSRLSEQTNSAQLNSNTTQRSNNSNNKSVSKPRSFEDDESDLEQSTLSHNYYNTIHGASANKYSSNYVPVTSIFSTKVITGAISTPDLNRLLERKRTGLICSETAVVAPLETLNTNLNYKILDDFIGKITDSTTKYLIPNSLNNDNNTIKNVHNNKSSSSPKHIPYVSTNRFSVQSVDNNNNTSGNDKKLRVNFDKVTHHSINTITELPEKTLDEER
ncbi:unnamed protein product, partial [Rotaria sordida]